MTATKGSSEIPPPELADEDPFDLIQRGIANEAASNRWGAADFYSCASTALRRRADGISSQLRKEGNLLDSKKKDEKRKVISLYRGQSLEYMYKARHCLLQALTFENEKDKNMTLEVAKSGVGTLDPLCSMITEEESRRRKLTFQTLFLREIEIATEFNTNVVTKSDNSSAPTTISSDEPKQEVKHMQRMHPRVENIDSTPTNKTNSTNPSPSSRKPTDEIDGRRQSIESRLADLNSSLLTTNLPNVPPPFISGSNTGGEGDSQNRIEEIQRGLGRLGVSLPDHSKNSDFIAENLSDEDQMKLIIQQARDEVRVEKGCNAGAGTVPNDIDSIGCVDDDIIDENDSMFEGYDDEEDDIDVLLMKAEKLMAKKSAEVCTTDDAYSSSSEIVQIRKAQALLLEARMCLEMETAHFHNDKVAISAASNDEENDNELEEEPKTIDEVEQNDGPDVSSNQREVKENLIEKIDPTFLAAREKARERIENAEQCLKAMLENWS